MYRIEFAKSKDEPLAYNVVRVYNSSNVRELIGYYRLDNEGYYTFHALAYHIEPSSRDYALIDHFLEQLNA